MARLHPCLVVLMAVESQRAELLYPRDTEQLQENFGTVNLNNPHAAISPDGSLISVGDKLACKHIVFNDQYGFRSLIIG